MARWRRQLWWRRRLLRLRRRRHGVDVGIDVGIGVRIGVPPGAATARSCLQGKGGGIDSVQMQSVYSTQL